MPLNGDNNQNALRNKDMSEMCQKSNIFDSPPTFYYPMWMGFGMPLFEINQEKYENSSEDTQGRKILTNVKFLINIDHNKDATKRVFSMKVHLKDFICNKVQGYLIYAILIVPN